MQARVAGALPTIGVVCMLLAGAPPTVSANPPPDTGEGAGGPADCPEDDVGSGGDLASLLLASPPGENAPRTLLDALLPTNPDCFLLRIRESWPPPVSPGFKELVLRSLPKEGEVDVLSKYQQMKVAAVEQILGVLGRSGIYEIKIIRVEPAFLGLHARVVLLISESALDLHDTGELQALVAHEMGHEYTWEEYHRARTQDDCRSLRHLELLCDAIAILVLRQAGVDPGRLAIALEKQTTYNQLRFGFAQDQDQYPDLGVRKKFVHAVSAWAVNNRSPSRRDGSTQSRVLRTRP
jgi:hypothetical protein